MTKAHDILLDKYRAAAKRAAWYDEEGGQPNYNPFRKIRTRTKDVGQGDEESALRVPTNQSMPVIGTSRHPSLQLPKHADTMPTSSEPSTSTFSEPSASKLPKEITASEKGPILNHDRQQTSQDSWAPTSDTVIGSETKSEEQEGELRRRKFPYFGQASKTGEEKDIKKSRTQSDLLSRDKQKFTAVGQFKATILNSWINVLLIFVPIGIAVNYTDISKVAVFVINFIAIIPLAAMLSYATEEIALRTGETIGGLLNATFG